MTVPNITLNNGVSIPQLGFGVWQVPAEDTEQVVLTALEVGYRSIDTAQAYHNEEGVGQALRASGLPREEVFITSKLWNEFHGYDDALRTFDESLRRLGVDYIDLFLIHWPVTPLDRYVEAWRALERVYSEGRARAIGVSNFNVDHLTRLFDETETVPALNQIELHPEFIQTELREFHAKHGIATEAWSPLGQGRGLLDRPELAQIGAKYGKTPAQVTLRWHLQLGNIVIPKSVTPSRIRENFQVFDFTLDEEDMARINALDSGRRLGPDPATFIGF